MAPKKDKKEGGDDFADPIPQISHIDVEKSMFPFSGDDAMGITTWIKDFQDIASLLQWGEAEKLIYAKRLLTGTARLFLRSSDSFSSWDQLKQALSGEFGCKLSAAAIHKRLAARKMKSNETHQQYFLTMKELAKLGSLEDDALMEYVIDGILDAESNKAVLYGAEDIKDFRKKLDLYSEMKKKITSRATHTTKPPPVSRTFKERRLFLKTRCYNCGELDHQAPNCTKGVKCFRCNNFGHKSNECPENKKKTLKIQRQQKGCSFTPYKNVKINDVMVQVLIDTGSDVNLIKTSQFNMINGDKYDYDPNTSLRLTGIAEREIQSNGSFLAKVQIDESYFDTTIHIVEDDTIPVDIILGNPILNEVEINFTADGICAKKVLHLTTIEDDGNVPDVGEAQFTGKIKKIINDYNPKNLKKESKVELKIILTDETPVYQTPRRLSPLELDVVNRQIEEWLAHKIIVPSKSDYASPIVLAKKKNNSYRLCIDYRRLNKKIIKDRFPLPLIEDQIDRLKHATLFTSLDLKNGFMHVNVNEESQKYTSFVTPQGQFEFCKMPFGLCTAPSVFQRFVNDVFQDIIQEGTALAYLDDLIIPAKTEEEALFKLYKVLQRAEEYGLQFNWAKCHFLKREINYLGYIVKEGEIEPSKEKVAAVEHFRIPTNIKSLQSYLGLTGYFRKFIKNYSIIAKPLTDLLKKGTIYNFDETCEKAFVELKRSLCQSPVLKIYDPSVDTELHTDASGDGYGAVLLQRNPKDGQMHPVQYMSKKTTPAEKKYHSYYLEILAIVEAIKKFRVYLLGIRFKIVTDCSALTMTLQKKELPPRVARWALMLEEYDYVIEHRPGIRMKHADALSRNLVINVNILTDTAARLKKTQDDDMKIKLLKKVLETESYEDYVLDNGIVWKVQNGMKLLVVPKKMQNEIIRKYHQNGHFGVIKTEELITREFYIENIRDKIKTVIDNCVECILISHKKGRKEGYLNPINKGDKPLSTYHIDHLGPLSSTNKNYKYLLTIVDGFTKFTWIYPTKTTCTEEVLDKLKIQQQTFGSPQLIISDRNASFTSNAFKEYCESENIIHHTITTGQPRGNGQVERVHQIIINVLSKLTVDDPTKWYRRISAVQRSINSTYQRSIQMTPFELLTGVKMRNQNDEIIKLIEEESVQNFNEEREELRRKAKEGILKIQEENKKNYNRKRKTARQYNVGDLVAIKRTQFVQGYKLYPKYLGPYEIIQKKRNDRYGLRKVGQGEGPLSTSSSADMMKPWATATTTDDSSEADE